MTESKAFWNFELTVVIVKSFGSNHVLYFLPGIIGGIILNICLFGIFLIGTIVNN